MRSSPPRISAPRRLAAVFLSLSLLILCVDLARADCPSWIFRRSQYTHDPVTNARVAQYSRIPPVEPLDDPREVTSIYRRTRSVLRGINGATDTYYQVQSFGNGRGGLDAEWERFHDAWKESYTAGGSYNYQYPMYGYPPPWHANPYGHYPYGPSLPQGVYFQGGDPQGGHPNGRPQGPQP
ncbi:MAG: hypothetical protein JW829_14160 [Pirellulales bacterium]|nr:hypothetical protein [Pirellulales bacterium]